MIDCRQEDANGKAHIADGHVHFEADTVLEEADRCGVYITLFSVRINNLLQFGASLGADFDRLCKEIV